MVLLYLLLLLTLAMTSIISILAEEASMVATHTSACSCCMVDSSASFLWRPVMGPRLGGRLLIGDWYTRPMAEHSI